MSENWDDYRFLLAMARHPTLSQAARALNVSHTTVSRRMDQLQERAGEQLLTRTPTGYVLTERGEQLRMVAERLEREALAADRVLAGSGPLEGTLTVTTLDVLVDLYWERFEAFIAAHPEIELHIRTATRSFDLARRDADVALRYSNSPPEGLVGRRVATHSCRVYAHPELLARYPRDSLASLPFVLWTEEARAKLTEAWHQQHVGTRPVARVNSSSAMRALVRGARGAAILLEPFGQAWDLTPLTDPIAGFDMDLWLLTHPDLRSSPRIQAWMGAFGG